MYLFDTKNAQPGYKVLLAVWAKNIASHANIKKKKGQEDVLKTRLLKISVLSRIDNSN